MSAAIRMFGLSLRQDIDNCMSLPKTGLFIFFLLLSLGLSQQARGQNAATFVSTDTTTLGNWHAVYGHDGYSVANDSQSLPGYASFAVQNQSNWTWVANSPDTKALQTVSGVGRIAAAWYSGSSFNFDVNFTDGNAHQFALYAIDWDEVNRAETIQILDASTSAVLDTRTLSNFTGGLYLVWNITGHVHITVTPTSGPNPVVSGVFFGGGTSVTSSATFTASDSTTQGNWYGAYGADGFSIANDSQNLPPYASISVPNQLTHTWDANPTDARALDTGSASGKIASAWTSSSAFTFDINFTDSNSHRLGLYALDWDSQSRNETIQVVDAGTEAILDTRNISGFVNGLYLAWNISGHVKINIIVTGGPNGVVSGLFFGGAGSVSSSASFIGTDTGTQGSWHGVYGGDGYSVANDSQVIPAFASFGIQNQANWTWATSTTDARALETGSGTERIAAGWYNPTSYTLGIHFTDGNSHQVALYALDWDNGSRVETIQIVNAATNTVLDTRTVSGFTNGTYLLWNISGHVKIVVTTTGGPNAMISGVFFGGASASAGSAPVITISSPSNNAVVSVPYASVTGTVTDSGSTISTVACNGGNATLAGANFSCNIPLFSVSNTVTVTATDLLGNSASAAVSVTVNMSAPTSVQITPGPVNMVPDQVQSFTVVDNLGHRRPDATWLVSNSSFATLATDGTGTLTAVLTGQVTLTANVQGVSGQTTVTILPSLSPGTVLWSAKQVTGFTTKKILEAEPTGNGPDLYMVDLDSNTAGDVLIRAFKADGEQLWQNTMSGVLANSDSDFGIADGIFNAVGDNNGGIIFVGAAAGQGQGPATFADRGPESHPPNFVRDLDSITGQQKWQFAPAGLLDDGGKADIAIGLDGTIFITEGSFGSSNGYASLDSINGSSGALISQVSLPVTTDGPGIYPGIYGAPIVTPDGSLYLELFHGTDEANIVSLLHIPQSGSAQFQNLTVADPGTAGSGEVIPDGQGGVLASWFPRGSTPGVTITDINPQGTVQSTLATISFDNAFSVDPTELFDNTMVLGDSSTAFITDGTNVTAFNTTTLQPSWNYVSTGGTLSFIASTSGGEVTINDSQLGVIHLNSIGVPNSPTASLQGASPLSLATVPTDFSDSSIGPWEDIVSGEGTVIAGPAQDFLSPWPQPTGALEGQRSATAANAIPIKFIQTQEVNLLDGTLLFFYEWSSSTGKQSDLASCRVGENVTYPGSVGIYAWPSPMVRSSTNPTIAQFSAETGRATDHNYGPLSYTQPYSPANFSASQVLSWSCPYYGNGSVNPFVPTITITRQVFHDTDGYWKYQATKSGAINTIRLPNQ